MYISFFEVTVLNFFSEISANIQFIDVYKNSYGVTGVGVDYIYYKKQITKLYNLPIGKTFKNVTIYVLNEVLRIQPIEVLGKLFIGSSGFGRGYLNQPELTECDLLLTPTK
ncbi:AMP-binding protein [Bacillus toyonensis]|uniref:AMP-binding protein n=1 Tax=Bacillus toyonensis TaxID=155322 RepID=UPI0021D01910|nr:AMP-binding protein [Bacillus toyonensis]MCU4771309.1 AMP-binding protein [Bacillus toyonensis]MCU5583925.1 AMP-binding protein [Bacillus toyonensis]